MNFRNSIPLALAIACLFTPPAFAATKCSAGTLAGDYGFSGSGFVPEPQKGSPTQFDPVTEVAIVRYDGKGMVKIYATKQYHGGGGGVSLSGNYEIEESCVGTATLKMSDGTDIKWHFVVVHGGREVETMEVLSATDARPLYSITFTQKKL